MNRNSRVNTYCLHRAFHVIAPRHGTMVPQSMRDTVPNIGVTLSIIISKFC